MKNLIAFSLLAGCLMAGAVTMAADAPAKKAKSPMMRYMVVVPHTAEECVATLDDFDASKSLSKFEFGCKTGDHTAYAIVTARSEEAAKAMVPEKQRDKAKVVELHRFSAAELKKIHSMKS